MKMFNLIVAHIQTHVMANWKKFAMKTMGWAVVSGTIIWLGLVAKGVPLWPALTATLVASVFKTFAYPLYEAVCCLIEGGKAKCKCPCVGQCK